MRGIKVFAGAAALCASLAADPAAAQTGENVLAAKWCQGVEATVSWQGGILQIEDGGDEVRYRNVRFAGCEGATCRYTGDQGRRWTAMRKGSGLIFKGPAAAGKIEKPVTLTLQRCR